MYFAKSAPKTVLVGNSYIIPLDIARGQVLIDLEQEQSQRRFLSNSLAQLPDPDADETYTAADLGRLLGITRQGATLLVQREFSAEADGGNYAIPLADVRAYIERKIAQHEARIAHLQGSLAKLQETDPVPQDLPTAE
ncbi:MAG: hypothetical protein OT477_03460 [Chloroflexi bacterium]|nr:hypothetical protein [Chloroflexota bacterium]